MGTPYTLCNVYMHNIVHNINALFAWRGGVSIFEWKLKQKIKI